MTPSPRLVSGPIGAAYTLARPRSGDVPSGSETSGDAAFDNTRARSLGIPSVPRLIDYLEVCLRRARDRTIAEQALDDA